MIIGISGKIGSGKDLSGLMIQYLTSDYRNRYHFNEWYDRVTKHGSKTHSRFITKKFADKLKDMVCLMLNCTRAQLEDRVFKETPLGEEWWLYTDGISITPYMGGDTRMLDGYDTRLQKTTPRLLLQLLGTDCGRYILHPNVWVNSLMSEYVEISKNRTAADDDGGLISKKEYYKEFPDWVITDVRFPNEADAILSKGGVVLRINRPKIILTEQEFISAGELIVEHASETALDHYQNFTAVLDNSKTKQFLLEQVKAFV